MAMAMASSPHLATALRKIVLVGLLASAGLPALAQITPAQISATPPDKIVFAAVFQFGRTMYFHALVDQMCRRTAPDRVAADDAKLRGLAGRLRARFGQKTFDVDRPPDVSRRTAGRSCDEITVRSYEAKISDLSLWTDRADATNAQPPRPLPGR